MNTKTAPIGLITIFARQEPTTEPFGATQRFDTVIYRDRECKNRFVRFAWWSESRPRRRSRITLNCYSWNLEWLPKLQPAAVSG